MDDQPLAYDLRSDYRLVPLRDGMPAASWNDGLKSEQISEGFCVNLFDFRVAEEELLAVQGPATFSISLFLNGSGRLSLESGPALDILPGSLFLFHSQSETKGTNQVDAGSHVLGIDFRFSIPQLDRLGLSSLGCLVRAFSDHANVGEILFMRRQLNAPLQCIARDVLDCKMVGAARRVFLHSKGLELLAHIIALCEAEPGVPGTLGKRDRSRVQMAVEMVQQRYSDPWTIADLAREVGINERKLKCGFRQVLGRTVHDHLERTRISAAQSLLADEGLSVTETALAVGYGTPSHFAKVFRRRVGATPSDWRRRSQGVSQSSA